MLRRNVCALARHGRLIFNSHARARGVASFNHHGKLVIVTGGAQGIGKAISLAFKAEGAKVVSADLDSAAGMELAMQASEMQGSDAGQLKFIYADFSDPSECERVVKEAQEWAGGAAVSCLVNNVGIQIDNNTPVFKSVP